MTIRTNVNLIRWQLEKNKDGMSIRQLSDATGVPVSALQSASKCIPDLYVDRWAPNKQGKQWEMVYCLLEKPPIPAKPAMRASEYLRTMA